MRPLFTEAAFLRRRLSRAAVRRSAAAPRRAGETEAQAAGGADLRYVLWSGSIVSGVLLTLVAFVYACTL